MYKNLRWKFLTILAVTVLAVAAFWPPWTRVKRGLDLQGGVHLQLKVKTDDAVGLETETAADQLKTALKTANLTVGSIRTTGLDTFVVEGVTNDSQFRTIADQQVGQTFNPNAIGANYTFTMKPNIVVNTKAEAVRQAIQTIGRRVNELGVSEPLVMAFGNRGDQIVVELPGVTDVGSAKEVIKSTAFLSLHIVEGGPAADQATLLAATGGKLGDDMQIVPGDAADLGATTGQSFYLLRKTPVITGRDLQNARTGLDQYNKPNIRFSLKSAGAQKFGEATGNNIGRNLAIVLDGRVVSAPRIDGRISNDGEISGRFSQEDADKLSLTLRSGALPASMTYEAENSVGPSLGADSIRAGVIASITGLGLVTLFMLLYYRLSGINAFVSVILNLAILLGCMAYAGAVMTLPGIAGFILTIGMGVDSNVLIFERIREELAMKKGVRQAIAASFDRVFITIVDTHVSSLIAAIFLYQFGTGPIRGFATTLVFGLLANIFTSVFVSRTLFEFVLSRKPAGAATISI